MTTKRKSLSRKIEECRTCRKQKEAYPGFALIKNCAEHADKAELEEYIKSAGKFPSHLKTSRDLQLECAALLKYSKMQLDETWKSVYTLANLLNVALPSQG